MPFACTRVLAALDVVPPFVGPRELERRRGRRYEARLGANECLFGVSPAAMQVLIDRGHELTLYSDPTHTDLRHALAARWRQPPERIVVAEGIEGLLGLFVRAVVDAGDVAVTSRGTYPSVDYYVRGCGGRLIHVPYLADCAIDLEHLALAAHRYGAKLVYLANPDNPTGRLIPAAQIEAFRDALPPACLLILDEAYVEFAPPADVLSDEACWPALVRMRTFSKLYGLAGARVGYAVADPELVRWLDRIRQHFAVSKLSQEMALAALGDDPFVAEVLARVSDGRERYVRIAIEAGIATLPSAANFVAFDFGDAARARIVADRLEAQDVFVRRPAEPPVDRLVRVTVGPPDACACFRRALIEAVSREDRRSCPDSESRADRAPASTCASAPIQAGCATARDGLS